MQPCASAVFPCAGGSGLVPRAAQCLEGHWVKMRPGASVMAHPLVDGCGLSQAVGPARNVVLCCHRSVFSSPPRRRMFRLLVFFHEPSRFRVLVSVGANGITYSINKHISPSSESIGMAQGSENGKLPVPPAAGRQQRTSVVLQRRPGR